MFPDILGRRNDKRDNDDTPVEQQQIRTVAEEFGWYYFFMDICDHDLVKFKTIIYYPIEELMYYYTYRLHLKNAANVKQL